MPKQVFQEMRDPCCCSMVHYTRESPLKSRQLFFGTDGIRGRFGLDETDSQAIPFLEIMDDHKLVCVNNLHD